MELANWSLLEWSKKPGVNLNISLFNCFIYVYIHVFLFNFYVEHKWKNKTSRLKQTISHSNGANSTARILDEMVKCQLVEANNDFLFYFCSKIGFSFLI